MWEVRIHRLVLEKDFKKMDNSEQKKILLAIEKKLTLDPVHFGKPLTGILKGFFRLRVDDLRIIYTIEKQVLRVLVVKAGKRRDSEVYAEMENRISNL